MPRQTIHGILYALEELGLVERAITRPLRFKGIPAKQGVTSLLEQKIQETKTMQTKTKIMMKNFHPENGNNNVYGFEPNFVLVPKKDPSITKRREEIDNAKKEIDFITSWKRFPLTVNTWGDAAKKALQRGVKIRVILEKPEDLNELPEQVIDYKKYPKYELRFILEPPRAVIALFDKKRALVKTSASAGVAEDPQLWTDNPCFLSILSDYFEILWITALEYIPEQIC